MIVLITDKETAQKLNGKYLNDCYINFTEIKQGWIVGENVLKDKNFAPIHDKLNELKQIEYINPINE